MIPTKRQVQKNGKQQWELDFGLDATGHRRRQFFAVEADADAEIATIKRQMKHHGDYWVGMTQIERGAVVSVLLQMKARGLTLGRVWEDWQQWSVDAGKQAANVKPTAYDEAVAGWKTRKRGAGISARYVARSADVLLKFGQGREKQNIHSILHTQLGDWLDARGKENEWSLSTRRTYMLLFSSLWETAIDEKWATVNIVNDLQAVKVPGPDVKIYPNETILHILAAIMDDELTQKALAPVVLCLQCCMRPEEVASEKAKAEGLPVVKFFNWGDIDLKHGRITVRPEIGKKGDQRTIKIQPAGLAWLKLAKKLGCELPPVNERRLVDQSCELIGLEDWIRDGLRKCCATHLREVYKNDYNVVRDMGNSVRVLLKHYADLQISPEESEEFWGIDPEKVEKFRKTKEWESVKRRAAEALATRPKPSASET